MKEHIDTSTGEVLTDYSFHLFPTQEDLVVSFTAPDGYYKVAFYWKPNWWIRLNFWLAGFKAEWH